MVARHASETKGFKATYSQLSKLRIIWDTMGFLVPYTIILAISIQVSNFLSVTCLQKFRDYIGVKPKGKSKKE